MGSSQQRRAEIGAAGAGVLSTGAEASEERDKKLGKWMEKRERQREGERRKVRKREEQEGRGGRPVGDPPPKRGKVMGLHTSKPSKNTGKRAHTHTHIEIMQAGEKKKREGEKKKKGKEITRWPVQNQHILTGSVCSLLSIGVFMIIISGERESDRDTCREGVDDATREG